MRLKGFDDYEVRLGDLLRGERATLGKSLMDVQRELRINANYISAIENCDYGAFETPSFVSVCTVLCTLFEVGPGTGLSPVL